MRRLTTLVALIVLVAYLPEWRCAGAQTFTSKDGRFTVYFPGGEPKQASQKVPLQGGGATVGYQYWTELESNNVSYMVMYNDFSGDYANGDPQATLASLRDGAVSKKTLLTDNAVSLNGVPGRSFTAKDGNWNYSMRQYLKGKRLYQLIVVSTNEHPATQADQFFNSLILW